MCKSKGRKKMEKAHTSTHVVHNMFSMNFLIEITEKEHFIYYKSTSRQSY